MPNEQNFLTEEQLEKMREQLAPVDTEPVLPGNSAPSAPFMGGRGSTEPFFSGSLPPQFQLDSSFSRARVLSDRVPKNALMPFGIQSNPSTNSAIQSTSRVEINSTPDVDVDVDTPIVNLQTGTSYTVQQADLNKLISINNAAGGNIYLPPVTGTTNVSLNNKTPGENFFNSGNTTVVGSTSTSVATWTVVGSPLNAGDTFMFVLRLVASPGVAGTATIKDNQNGAWTVIAQPAPGAAGGEDTIFLAYVTNQATVAIGGTLTLTLVQTAGGVLPDVNTVFNITGLKAFGASAQATGASPVSGAYTFGTAGLTVTQPTTFIALGDDLFGGMQSTNPDAFGGQSWTSIAGGSSHSLNSSYLLGITNATIKEVWHAQGQGAQAGAWAAILAAFVNTTASDIQQFTNNFIVYVENKGTGIFNLVSSVPIDGVNGPVPLSQNQGTLLLYDATSNGWYTVRGIGGSSPNTVTTGVTLTNNQIILGAGAKTVKVGDLTGDATTSGSNVVSVVKVSGATIPISDLLVGTNASGQFVLGATAVNAQTGTTYTIADSDRLKVITTTNVAAMAITLPQAGASSLFVAGWFCYLINRGTGIATITPTTSTINGNAALVLQKNQAVIIVSDGTNYVALGTLLGDQNAALIDGYLLAYDGTNHKWFPIAPGSISGINAVQLRGISIAASAATPGNQNVLKYSSANNDWEPVLADGMEHGDSVWAVDSAKAKMEDDFNTFLGTTFLSSTNPSTSIGELGWAHFGVGSQTTTGEAMIGGAPPHMGIYQWTTLQSSNGFSGLMLNMVDRVTSPYYMNTRSFALLENPGWKMSWVFKFSGDLAAGGVNTASFHKKSFYVGLCGSPMSAVSPSGTTNSWGAGGGSARPDYFMGLRYDTSTFPQAWGIGSIANAAAGVTVYTMNGTNSNFTGTTDTFKNCTVTVRGCTNAANNGTFTCTTSSSTTMTLNNASGVSETTTQEMSMQLLKINITAVTANSPAAGQSTLTFANPWGTSQSFAANGGFIGHSFTGAGFTNAGNNVTATCIGSTSTSIILNVAGVTETPVVNTAFVTPGDTGPNDDGGNFKLEVVQNSQYANAIRHNLPGTVSDTGIAPQFGNWYRLDVSCVTAGQVVMTLYDENNAVNFSHTFTVAQITTTTGSISWNTDGNKMGNMLLTPSTSSSGVPTVQFPPFAAGSTVAISGLTGSVGTAFNGTWVLESASDRSGGGVFEMFIYTNTANLGSASQTATLVGYAAYTPYIVWGTDDTGAGAGNFGNPSTFGVDFFSLAWNKAIASPSTVPNPAKSRYW